VKQVCATTRDGDFLVALFMVFIIVILQAAFLAELCFRHDDVFVPHQDHSLRLQSPQRFARRDIDFGCRIGADQVTETSVITFLATSPM
jgi:hypothetical protein